MQKGIIDRYRQEREDMLEADRARRKWISETLFNFVPKSMRQVFVVCHTIIPRLIDRGVGPPKCFAQSNFDQFGYQDLESLYQDFQELKLIWANWVKITIERGGENEFWVEFVAVWSETE